MRRTFNPTSPLGRTVGAAGSGFRTGAPPELNTDLSAFSPWIDLDFSQVDTITFNGDKIITIVDRNDNGRSATQANDANRFQWVDAVQNGYAIARGSATKSLVLPDMSGFTVGEIFITVEMNADSGDFSNTLWRMGVSAEEFNDQHYAFVDNNVYEEWGTTIRKATGNPTPDLSDWQLYHVLSAANLYTTWFNENQHYTTGVNTVGFNATPYLGIDNTGARRLDGDVGRIVIFDSAKSAEDRAAIAGILKLQWDTP